MTTNSLTTCCETSGRTLADSGAAAAASAQTPVYCPVYESRLLATARHELNSAAALGVYGSPYANSQGYGNYVAYGSEASAFYSLVSPPQSSRPGLPAACPKGPLRPERLRGAILRGISLLSRPAGSDRHNWTLSAVHSLPPIHCRPHWLSVHNGSGHDPSQATTHKSAPRRCGRTGWRPVKKEVGEKSTSWAMFPLNSGFL